MNTAVEIHPLTPDRIDDYFAFFDHDAFADHPGWSWCYCTFYHIGDEPEAQFEGDGKEGVRNFAKNLIEAGTLKGYLAYSQGRPIGWCNAGEKAGYLRIRERRDLWTEGETAKIKAVVCFIVAAEYRGQGIATALLGRVIEDARTEGFDFLEAYPSSIAKNCFEEYHGPLAMYRRAGFVEHLTLSDCFVLRKAL